MKNLFLLILPLIIFEWRGYSQTIFPEIIAPSGAHFSIANAQLSWTLGETVTETYSTGMSQLTQGVHQTKLIVTAIEDFAESFQVKVYPNPVANLLNIEWQEISEPLILNLYDATGRQIWGQKIFNQPIPFTINLSVYATGNYYLKLRTQNHELIKTFTLFKIE